MDCQDIGKTTDPECILCGRCTSACNHDILKLRYSPNGRGAKVTAAFVAMALISGAFFAYGLTGDGYERTSDVNDIPCLGCLALDPSGTSGFAPFKGTVPRFMALPLNYSPVFLHYRTDVCSACDEMEPTIKTLEDEFGDRIEFIHINLDHAEMVEFASYDLFDVKGSPKSRTGVPMFVSCARTIGEDGAAQLSFSTSYGVMARQKLADSMNETLEMHIPASAVPAPADARAIVELFVDTTCTFCPYTEDALVEMKEDGDVALVTFVTDTPGETGAYAKHRESMLRQQTSAGGAHPWAVFAGGQAERMGGMENIGDYYVTDLSLVNYSSVPLALSATMEDEGTGLDIRTTMTNTGGVASSVLLQGFLTERNSRWPNLHGEPIPYAFVDLVVNETRSVQPGESIEVSVMWSGTDALAYGSFTPANLALVIAAYTDGVLSSSAVFEEDTVGGIVFSNPYLSAPALPNGTSRTTFEIRNHRTTPAVLEMAVEVPSGWVVSFSPQSFTVIGGASYNVTGDISCDDTSVGDVSEVRVLARGVSDMTLFASGVVKVETKSDVLPPVIVLARLPSQPMALGETTVVRATVGDDNGLSSVKISWYSCTETTCSAVVVEEMKLDGNEYAAEIAVLRSGDTVIHYRIVAEDLEGNQNATVMFDIEVEADAPEAQGGGPPMELGLLIFVVAVIVAFCLIAIGKRK
jgi:thiol-disulfide isomerase/thioredoxin